MHASNGTARGKLLAAGQLQDTALHVTRHCSTAHHCTTVCGTIVCATIVCAKSSHNWLSAADSTARVR
jgi:hypothetical protein